MRDDLALQDLFEEIQDSVDIILSHDPPFGMSDADKILKPVHKQSPQTHIRL